MKFDLTKELIDQIIYGMEDQEQEYYIDLQRGEVVPEHEIEEPDEERYVLIPDWRPVDGYNLMERFLQQLRNPIYREQLRSILASGQRVFRRFKDTVKQRPEIERMWYHYKDREMHRRVYEWYNDLRETWGLDPVEPVYNETQDLVQVDFEVREVAAGEVPDILELDRASFSEMLPEASPQYVHQLYVRRRAGIPLPSDPESRLMRAYTAGGDPAGFLWAVEYPETRVALVAQLRVEPEYRGLGVARVLLERYIRAAHEAGLVDLELELSGAARGMGDALSRLGFEPVSETYALDINRWARDELGD